MANILINDIADYLADEELGAVGTDIFVSNQPSPPDNCITVIDTGGTKPPIDIPSKKATFQVLIRNTDYATGAEKLASIRTALHNKYGITLVNGGNYCHSINALAEGGHIGKDDAGNDEFSINFLAYVR